MVVIEKIKIGETVIDKGLLSLNEDLRGIEIEYRVEPLADIPGSDKRCTVFVPRKYAGKVEIEWRNESGERTKIKGRMP